MHSDIFGGQVGAISLCLNHLISRNKPTEVDKGL
jgi:hypothetical protein